MAKVKDKTLRKVEDFFGRETSLRGSTEIQVSMEKLRRETQLSLVTLYKALANLMETGILVLLNPENRRSPRIYRYHAGQTLESKDAYVGDVSSLTKAVEELVHELAVKEKVIEALRIKLAAYESKKVKCCTGLRYLRKWKCWCAKKPVREGSLMIGDDDLLLDSIEDIHRVLQATLNKLDNVRSVHVLQFERWGEELASLRRIFEDISLPARLILEHLLESKHKGGLVVLEAEHTRQSPTGVTTVRVEEFGIIKLTLGELEIAWRDNNYSYYFYPDKVVLHAVDEKSAIKLFFSLGFRRQLVETFPALLDCPNVVYVHPQIEEWLNSNKKVI